MMVTQSHINELSNLLATILKSELNLGNEIAETAKGWPDEDFIMIFLKYPFRGSYNVDGIDYKEIDDPHYWKAEYFDRRNKNVLACRF